jgi:hypothetical protein
MSKSSIQPVVVLVEDLVLVRMMVHDVLEGAGFQIPSTANRR